MRWVTNLKRWLLVVADGALAVAEATEKLENVHAKHFTRRVESTSPTNGSQEHEAERRGDSGAATV